MTTKTDLARVREIREKFGDIKFAISSHRVADRVHFKWNDYAELSQLFDELCDIAERALLQYLDKKKDFDLQSQNWAKDQRESIRERDALRQEIQRLGSRLAEATEALEFAEGAIENAIYTEDGLDGDTGKVVLEMINPLIRTPEEMAERAKQIAKWPVV